MVLGQRKMRNQLHFLAVRLVQRGVAHIERAAYRIEQIFHLVEQDLRLVLFTQQKPVHAVMLDAHDLRQSGAGA